MNFRARAPRLLAAALALPLAAKVARAETLLLQVVVDHSGVLHDEQDPQGKTAFNSFLEELLRGLARAHRRDRDDTRVVLISAVEPPRVLWSGDAAAFYRDGLESPAVEAVVSGRPNGCNNLPEALAEARVNLRLEAADAAELHVVTSGVHSGPDCAGLTQEGYAELVESPDPALAEALAGLVPDVDRVAVHFLTAAQRRGLLDALNPAAGVEMRVQGQSTEF